MTDPEASAKRLKEAAERYAAARRLAVGPEPRIHRQDERVTVHHGDCLDVLPTLPDQSIDAVVTDPPYELAFMGRTWDSTGIAFNPQVWRECLRVLKPGGHLLAFGGSRTWHRLAVAIEDAGFELRDSIAWLYGNGFPKSLDVSKAIDKAAGADREVVGRYVPPSGAAWNLRNDTAPPGYKDDLRSRSAHMDITAPATAEARQWAGWGTALKPAFEPIVVARKPLSGTVAANVLTYGAGALNIDACRVPATDKAQFPVGYVRGAGTTYAQDAHTKSMASSSSEDANPNGRWPTNVVFDSDAADALDEQTSQMRAAKPAGAHRRHSTTSIGDGDLYAGGGAVTTGGHDGSGASRFFPVFRYTAKSPSRERPVHVAADGTRTAHPTVKPLELIRWLVRLVTPPGGVVLDWCAGSGTTGEAALLEGMRAVLIEQHGPYLPLIDIRLDRVERDLFTA